MLRRGKKPAAASACLLRLGAEQEVDRRGLLVVGDLAHARGAAPRATAGASTSGASSSGSRRPVAGVKGIAATSLG